MAVNIDEQSIVVAIKRKPRIKNNAGRLVQAKPVLSRYPFYMEYLE
jgi:hypothetical protein